MVHKKGTLQSAFKFATAGLALLGLSGCATMQLDKKTCMESSSVNLLVFGTSTTKYNSDCGLENSARAMVESNDPGLQSVGYGVLEKMHKPVQEGNEELRRNLLKKLADEANSKMSQSMECKVKSVTGSNGQRQLVLGDCRPK